MKAGSNLEKVFESGEFAVTAEIGPPQSSNPEPLTHHAKMMKGSADAFNLTDNQTAVVRLSSIASAAIIMKEGIEPVIQMTCRDRNRIALQSDLLGASAIGVRNVLCLTGDHQTFGNEKSAKSVFDFDSVSELYTFDRLRTEGVQSGGEKIEDPPKVYLGCAENPFATPYEFRAMRLAKKIAAGADFVQTQAIFDMDMFESWMDEVRGRGLDKKVHILAGVIPMKTAGAARYMKNKVPGMIVPNYIIDRMKKASDPKEEGIKLCVEQIETLRTVKGVHGVHIMAVMWEEMVPRIVEMAGLMPRPAPK
ncbi:MAG: methylenetetrahydrofolate reductase [Methanobacteriota archaeon]|nr:MAG: methylenetetrahydrofolate reductase [Euryarchaeota archaeon]